MKVKKSHDSCKNSLSVSIRKAPAQNVLSDTNENEKEQSPVLRVDALRSIARVVRAINSRIRTEAGGAEKSSKFHGFDRGAETPSHSGGQDFVGGEENK